MILKRFCFVLSFLCCIAPAVRAQELFCSVSVTAPQLQSDREIYDQLQKAIMEYMNNRKWSSLVFEQRERIKCNMVIIINERPDIDRFSGTLQFRIIRPVFNSTYETVLVNMQDKDFSIRYIAFQNLEFSENAYVDNLTNLLNYYANLALAFDFASYSASGGADYFAKMNTYVALAASSNEPGWNSFGGARTRFRLTQELMSASFKGFHSAFYTYHRLGLDVMEKDMTKARTNILAALKEMQKANAINPGSYLIRVFMDAKQQEIINIFKNAFANEKQLLLGLVENLDPPQLSNYQKIMEED